MHDRTRRQEEPPSSQLSPLDLGVEEELRDGDLKGDVVPDMAPYEVLTEILSDLESGKVRLRAAQDKLIEAGLSYSPGYQEIGEFISAALRNTEVATEITLRRREG